MLKVAEMEYDDAMEKAHEAIQLMTHIAKHFSSKVPEHLHENFYDEIRNEIFK